MVINPDSAGRPAPDAWARPLTWLVLATGWVLRMTNLGNLSPFIDETSSLLSTRNYEIHPVMERIFFGKYLGYLLQRPFVEFASDQIWAGRAASAVFGLLAALVATSMVRRLANPRAALACAVLLGLAPQLVFHDRLALPESSAVFFVALGGLAWTLGRERQQWGMFVLAGLSVACACATKIYAAPIFVFIPVLASGSPGGMRSFFRQELPPIFWGIVAGGFLLFLSALDSTWKSNLSLEELMRIPKMIVGGSASVPSLGGRVGNAAGLITGYVPVTFWILLVSVFFTPAQFRQRVFGCVIAAAGAFLLYAVFFRTFVATRYFNVIWLPLALGVGLSVGSFAPGAASQVNSVGRWVGRIQLMLLAVVALQFTRRDATLLTRPELFPLPHSDYFQYFSGWPSGRGLAETQAYLQGQSLLSDKPILVLTLMDFRHGNTSLPMLLRTNSLVRFIPSWEGNDFAVTNLPAWLRANLVLVLVEPMGTPVNFEKTRAAGYESNLVFSAPDFEGAPGYRLFRLTRKP